MKDKDEGERMKGPPFILTPSLFILASSTALRDFHAGENKSSRINPYGIVRVDS